MRDLGKQPLFADVSYIIFRDFHTTMAFYIYAAFLW
jgi:hypothetical protein